MPAVYFQSNVAFYSVAGSGGNLPCAYLGNNAGGNIGLAWVTTADSTIPSGVDDSNSNVWVLVQESPSNLGTQSWWACPNFNPGANTVTAHGLTGFSGGPNLTILEYVPTCPPGTTAITAMQPPSLAFNPTPPLSQSAMYNASHGTFFSTIVAGIWDAYNSAEVTLRTWGVSGPMYAVSAGIRIQYTMPTTVNTGAVGDCTVPNPHALNYVEFTYTPGTPALGVNWAYTTGVLLTSAI